MSELECPKGELLAVRCHDITVSLNDRQVGDFDRLIVFGMAVRLGLHLRGCAAVPYDLLRLVALHWLHIPPIALPAVIEVLAEAEFMYLDKQGATIRSVVPAIPYYEDMFAGIGEIASNASLSEPEQLTLALLHRLSASPASLSSIMNSGAEPKLVRKAISIGNEGGYLIDRRARGKDILVSPIYFPEHADSFADLVAAAGSTSVGKVLALLNRSQGWPLSVIKAQQQIGGESLSKNEVEIVVALASEGFASPPAISTSHAGTNFFLFSPGPSNVQLSPTKRVIYEKAMALVAAVRQGQLLPAKYAIRSPRRLLESLMEKKFLRANTEAIEQYQTLVTMRLGRLSEVGGGWARFELIDVPENHEAIKMALGLIGGTTPTTAVDDDIVLALQKGQEYVDSLISRQQLVVQNTTKLDEQTKREIDNLLLRGVT